MQNGVAIVLAVISLALPPGGVWLQQKKPVVKELWQLLRLRQAAEFFYYVGFPYGALVTGILTPRLLGLKGLEHLSLLASGSSLSDAQPIVALILVEALADFGPMLAAGLGAGMILSLVVAILTRYGVDRPVSSASLLHTFFYTLHGAFYWAIFWLVTGNLYLGVVFGSGWVLLEWMLVGRMQKISADRPAAQLVEGIILIFIATIFYYRPNLWLLWPIHLGLVVVSRQIYAISIKSTQAEKQL